LDPFNHFVIIRVLW